MDVTALPPVLFFEDLYISKNKTKTQFKKRKKKISN